MVNAESLNELWELLITDNKTHELNVVSDVYAPSRGPNIPFWGYKGMSDMITKSNGEYREYIIIWWHVNWGL